MSLDPKQFHIIAMNETVHKESIHNLLTEYFSWAEKLANSELNFDLLTEFGMNNKERYIREIIQIFLILIHPKA